MAAPLLSSRYRAIALILTLAMFAAACSTGSSDYVEYRDAENTSLFEIPRDWHLYERSELGEVGGIPFVTNFNGIAVPVESGVAFDGAPAEDPLNIGIPFASSPYPIGATSVRAITPDARDFISRSLLTQLVVPYDTNEVVRELVKVDKSFGQDFDGVEVIVVFNDEATASDAGAYVMSVTNPDVTQMYSIAVGCSLDCFQLHQDETADVMSSWLVNTRLE